MTDERADRIEELQRKIDDLPDTMTDEQADLMGCWQCEQDQLRDELERERIDEVLAESMQEDW